MTCSITSPKSADYLTLIFSLIGVLGLVFLCFWGMKKLNKRVAVMNGSKMRIIDRVNLGREGMLLIVSVCGKLMLIGATNQKIEKICDLDMTEEEYLEASPEQSKIGFAEIFAGVRNKKNEQKGKEEEKNDESIDKDSDKNE